MKGKLPLHRDLNPQALVFPDLSSESLLSIGQVCDNNCIVLFDDKSLKVYKNDGNIRTFLQESKQDNLILEETRNKQDGLYDVPFTKSKMNYKDKSQLELAQYLHGCAWSLAISTFQKCINIETFITWPGINDVKFKNYYMHLYQPHWVTWIKKEKMCNIQKTMIHLQKPSRTKYQKKH